MRERTFGTLVLGIATSLLVGCGEGAVSGSGSTDGGSGTVAVLISGEELATDGFAFPTGSEVVLSDGWELSFSHVIVVIDRVWMNENPDASPSDQSQMGERIVAQVDGPWAVDLHRKSEGGNSTPLFDIFSQDKAGASELVPGERYAFSYATAAPSEGTKIINFDDDAEAKGLLEEMKSKGYSMLYAGKATWKGADCKTSDDTYDFGALPTSVDFALGFATPSEYLNCQNQDNQGDPFEGEEYQRGVPIKDNGQSVAQMTFHVEHPFFSSVVHDSLLYFDQFVAPLVGAPEGTVLTTELLSGLDPEGFFDGAGASLPFRTCDGSPVPSVKQRNFETGSVPIDPKGNPAKALRDYRDFVAYVQSAQGHLNGGEGLCFTKRNYPSPP